MSKKSSKSKKSQKSNKSNKSSKSQKSNKSRKSRKELSDNFDPKTMAVIEHKGYKVMNKLGAGAFGTVFKAVRTSNDELAAVKVIDLGKMSVKSRQKLLPREIETLINSKHENLIAVHEIFRSNEKIYIFMEFAANGDITGYSRKHNGIEEKLARQWFLQVSKGLAFLHNELASAHRDIKTDNMLLDAKYIAKLSDFGFAKESFDKTTNKVLMSNTFCGTMPFESPQILEHKTYNPFKTDIWSMGVTFFTMFHGGFPFNYKDGAKVMVKNMKDYPRFIRAAFKTKLPEEANQLLEQMLNPDEEKRASVNDLVENAWLRKD